MPKCGEALGHIGKTMKKYGLVYERNCSYLSSAAKWFRKEPNWFLLLLESQTFFICAMNNDLVLFRPFISRPDSQLWKNSGRTNGKMALVTHFLNIFFNFMVNLLPLSQVFPYKSQVHYNSLSFVVCGTKGKRLRLVGLLMVLFFKRDLVSFHWQHLAAHFKCHSLAGGLTASWLAT